jgi:endonuclease/exonuclease/phosphatase family metal-dependent hydrolase
MPFVSRSRFRFTYLLLLLFTGVSFLCTADELVVMTWNLEDMDLFDGAGIERVPWQIEAEKAIAQTLRAVGPEIVLSVEAPSLTELQGFVSRYGLDYQVVHVRQQSGRRDFADSMALLTRSRVSGAMLATPPVPGSSRGPETAYLDWSYRGLLVAEYRGMTIVGVHLKSPWDGKQRSYNIRDAQARGLLNYMRNIEGNIIVLGDFNDSPGQDEKERSFRIPDTLGLFEGELQRSPGEEATQEKGFNVDHIFVRGGSLEFRRVVQTDWSLSDHRPVWTTVDFQD